MNEEEEEEEEEASIYDVRTEGGGGTENGLKFADKGTDFVDKKGEGSKYPTILWTSYMEATERKNRLAAPPPS